MLLTVYSVSMNSVATIMDVKQTTMTTKTSPNKRVNDQSNGEHLGCNSS